MNKKCEVKKVKVIKAISYLLKQKQAHLVLHENLLRPAIIQ